MRKLFVVFIMIFPFSLAKGQSSSCGTVSLGIAPSTSLYYVEPYDLSTEQTAYIALAVHILRDANGNGGLSSSTLASAVNRLNSAFEDAKMQFFVRSVDYIDNNDLFVSAFSSSAQQDALSEINQIADAVNVYFAPHLDDNGVGTFTADISESEAVGRFVQSVIVRNNVADSPVFPHEVGHYFNLFHTDEYRLWGRNCPGGNCETTGDLVCDTSPEPRSHQNPSENFSWECEYIGPTDQDECTGYYVQGLTTINAINLMSTSVCRIEFTPGQLSRARFTYNNKRPELHKAWVGFTNLINGSNAGGSFFVDGSAVVESGNSKSFVDQSQHQVRTQNERFTQNKHKRWNGNNSSFLLTKTFNPPAIGARSEENAEFEALAAATIFVQRIDDGATTGDVGFRDPWHLYEDGEQYDDFITYSVPSGGFTPTGAWNQTSGGVFLDQNPTFDPVFPSYWVKAPFTQTINGLTYFRHGDFTGTGVSFQNASAEETRVNFTSAGATVTVNYKAKLATFSSSGTASNNQRKIGESASGKFVIVYESANRIWFATSTNGGSSWSNDVEVGSADYTPGFGFWDPATVKEGYPSLVVKGEIVNIIWQWRAYDPVSEEKWFIDILLRRYNLATGAWSAIERLESFYVAQDNNYASTPVIDAHSLSSDGASQELKMVAWRSPYGIRVRDNYYGSWGSVATVTGTNSSSYYPAIVNYNSIWYSLVWVDNSYQTIRYIEAANTGSWSFANAEQVSPSGWSLNTRPSLGFTYSSGYKPTVAWQSDNNIVEGSSVHIRQRTGVGSGYGWSGSVTSFSASSQVAMNPVLGTYSSNGKHTVVWTISGSVYAATNNGSGWSGPSLLASGSGGGSDASINAQTPGTLKALWKKPNNQIFNTSSGVNPSSAAQTEDPVLVSSTGNSVNPTAGTISVDSELSGSPVAYRLNRHVIFPYPDLVEENDSPDALVAFEIAGLALNSTTGTRTVEYSDISDSTFVNTLRSKSFVVPSDGAVLSFAGAVYGMGFTAPPKGFAENSSPLASVFVYSESGGKNFLWSVPYSILSTVENGTFGEFKKINLDLVDFKGKEVCLEVRVGASGEGGNAITVDDYLILTREPLPVVQSSLALDEERTEVVPTEFRLHQNFPNPFNPSTAISFDLPTEAYVTLKVYDLMGKEVISGANGYFRSGRHTISLDLSHLASGVYLYRLTAGEFSDSKRLILVK